MKTVLLDPGHGGKDPGAIGYLIENGKKIEFHEATLTFDIAKRIWTKLTPSYSVFLTRKENEDKSLNDRCLLAKKLCADVFVSIHINSATSSQAKGYEAYSVRTPLPEYAKYKLKSEKLRDLILFRLSQDFPTWTNRGGKEANFQVIKYVPCPATLVELGFISNPEDLAFLQEPSNRERLATSLAMAIDIFAKNYITDRWR